MFDGDYYTPKEFAGVMQVAERTALDWASAGKYGAYRVGGRWRFPSPNSAENAETAEKAKNIAQ